MNTLLLVVIAFAVVLFTLYKKNLELDGRMTALADAVCAIQEGPELLSPDEKLELEEETTKLAQFSDECFDAKNIETNK